MAVAVSSGIQKIKHCFSFSLILLTILLSFCFLFCPIFFPVVVSNHWDFHFVSVPVCILLTVFISGNSLLSSPRCSLKYFQFLPHMFPSSFLSMYLYQHKWNTCHFVIWSSWCLFLQVKLSDMKTLAVVQSVGSVVFKCNSNEALCMFSKCSWLGGKTKTSKGGFQGSSYLCELRNNQSGCCHAYICLQYRYRALVTVCCVLEDLVGKKYLNGSTRSCIAFPSLCFKSAVQLWALSFSVLKPHYMYLFW